MTTPATSISPLATTRATSSASERSLETLGLWTAIVAFVLVGVIALPVFGFASVPIAGEGSVGQYASIASAATAVVAFIGGRLVVDGPTRQARIGVLDVIDIAAFAFAHAVIALLGWTLTATILTHGFVDAVVFPLPVLLLSGAAAALTGYVAFLSATHLDLQLLAIVLATFLSLGIITSMLTASDPHWWQENLSALGMTDDLSARTFNLTLIVAGVLVTTLARYATHHVPTSHPYGVVRVRTCLVIVGIVLGLVGVFPVDDFFAIHTGVASGMAVSFSILVFALRRWIPGMPRTFLLLGYLFVVVIVTLAVLFGIGYYTLTAVELVAGILVFTWIILFIRSADALRRDAEAAARA